VEVYRFNGSTGSHTTIIDTKYGNYCSCISFNTRGFCKHVEEASLKEMPIKFKREIKKMDSSLKAMNELFSGIPYKSDEPFVIFAAPSTGKSLWYVQEACYFSSKGLNVLYIDTEGSIGSFAETWGRIFETRFGALKGDIVIKQTADLYDLTKYLGFMSKIDKITSTASKKKKAAEKAGASLDEEALVGNMGVKEEFRDLGELENPEIDRDIKEGKIDVIILDSISAPINAKFQTGVQNYPARNDAAAAILGALQKIQIRNTIFIMATTHASTNPTNPYEIHEQMKGGRAVQHFGKNVVYIDKRQASDLANYRRLWGVRVENRTDWKSCQLAMITNDGYVDVDQEKLRETVFTDGERKRLEEYFAEYHV